MRTLLRSLALFAFVAALVASAGVPEAPARQKDDKKKDEKKKDDKAVEPGTIEVYQTKDGWRYKVVSAEGKVIAVGVQGFDKKEECLAVVEFLKTTMAKGKVVEQPAEKKKKDEKKKDEK
jgi:uncharacterized protein YegP (UPF0339 family)